MSHEITVRRALLSVSDKTGLVELARAMAARNVEIISTGGTARALREAGVVTTPVEELTGFPEIMGGRVKTLHPVIHGGLLGIPELDDHAQAMRQHGIEPIDLVCVNLYPFEETVARDGVTRAEAVEQIDIGGPSMIRSAAKNAQRVVVLTDPAQYGRVLAELEELGGATSEGLRLELMQAAYARTSAYDQAIAAYLAGAGEGLPARWSRPLEKVSDLRYGENPHQLGAVYRETSAPDPSVASASLLHGKPLSYNNVADAAAALELAMDLRLASGKPSACVIKHANPCGAAAAPELLSAVDLAMNGDPLAAFGGIVAVTEAVDAASAERLVAEGAFLEVIVAPLFSDEALATLKERWANVRLLAVGDLAGAGDPGFELRTFRGGALAQSADTTRVDPGSWVHAAGPVPERATLAAAAVVWVCAKHLRSNAVALGTPAADGGAVLVGGGAGQMDRVASCRIACAKAGARAAGAIAASDAFFPFSDGPGVLIDAGVRTIVHPGGSKRDAETLELCDQRGVTCLLTGERHFKH